MPVFFGGRLLISPTVMSVVDDSGLANKNLDVGNVAALIGQSVGGKPNTALAFGSPSEAEATLIGGELLAAVKKAFAPSTQTGGPATVIAIRVNPAVQSALNLLDGSAATVIALQSTDYGLYTNQIKVKVEAGSVSGKKLTTQFGNDYFSQDNVDRNAFSVQYSGGQATAQMSITNSTLTLFAPAGTAVATLDIANVYQTVQQVVDRINAVPGFAAAVLDGNGQAPSASGLDSIALQDVKTALYTAKATLQAVVDWFNSTGEGYVTATRAVGAGTLPANIPFTYLAGGSDGVTTNGEWSNAFTTLQQVDVQWVAPITSNASIWAMADAHCQFMSTVGKMERRGIVGEAVGCSDSQALTDAKALNSDRTSLVHIGYYDFDSTGKLVLMPPYMLAALLAGMASGVNPGTPLTNKTISVRGLERNLRNPTDTDPLILGGVLCVENTPKGYKVVQSISTWLTNRNYNRREMSTGVAVDFTARNVRDALDDLRGVKGTPQVLARAVSIADTTLRKLAQPEPQGPGVLTGDDENPPYRNITATLEGDVVNVQFECQPVIGVNYVLVSIFARAYAGSATA